MAELVSIIINNPYIGQFLTSLSASFGTETGNRVAQWIWGSLEGRFSRNKTPPKEVEKAQRYFATFSKKKKPMNSWLVFFGWIS
jgi:hypothetical protein